MSSRSVRPTWLTTSRMRDALIFWTRRVAIAIAAAPIRANPLFERALAIREKMFGPEHPGTAASLNNLAGLLQDQGDSVKARPLFERREGVPPRGPQDREEPPQSR